jgi:hypothetical protein
MTWNEKLKMNGEESGMVFLWSGMIKWVAHVARTGMMKNAYAFLIGKPGGKSLFRRSKRRCYDSIKMDLKRNSTWWRGPNSAGSVQGPLAGYCEHDETSCYIKSEFLDWLSDFQFLFKSMSIIKFLRATFGHCDWTGWIMAIPPWLVWVKLEKM